MVSRPLVGFDGGGGLVSSSHLGRSTLVMEVIGREETICYTKIKMRFKKLEVQR